jgi:hypothetical protein
MRRSMSSIPGCGAGFFSGDFAMFDPFEGQFQCAFDSLTRRPQLAVRVAHIMGLWAHVDALLAVLLSRVLHADAEVGAILFSSVHAEAGRMAMIRAIVEERLSEPLQKEFSALQDKARKVGKHRDEMAHGLWGHSDEKENCLVLANTRQLNFDFARLMGRIAQRRPLVSEGESQRPRQKPQTFRDVEFDFLEKQIAEVTETIIKLHDSLLAEQYPPQPPEAPSPSSTPPPPVGIVLGAMLPPAPEAPKE